MALFSDLPEDLKERYLAKKAKSAFSMVKPSDSSRTWKSWHMTCYALLVRLLSAQCVVEEDEETKTRTVAVRPNRDVASDSLQNPSDSDASYDGHRGKGYQAQVAETYSKNEQAGHKPLNLITHIEVEPAHKSDAHAVAPYLDNTEQRVTYPLHRCWRTPCRAVTAAPSNPWSEGWNSLPR